jgi:hypothetical protein
VHCKFSGGRTRHSANHLMGREDVSRIVEEVSHRNETRFGNQC